MRSPTNGSTGFFGFLVVLAFVIAVRLEGQIAVGERHALFLRSDGTVWASGSNEVGQLGDGTFAPINRASPVKVMSGVKAVAAGAYHSLFLKIDGTVWATGFNDYGQLGDGNLLSRAVPVQIMSGVAAIEGGHFHSLFLKTDGTVWLTGSHEWTDGNLQRSVPVKVFEGAIAISAGTSSSLILKGDGTAWGFGIGSNGQFGNGSRNAQKTPIQIATSIVAVSSGYGFSLLLRSDGTVLATGSNFGGQLGTGGPAERLTFAPVNGTYSGISAGSGFPGHSLFVKADGTAWGAGSGLYGKRGDGVVENRETPSQVMTGVNAVFAGSDTSFFVKSDGSILAAGSNQFGQFGDGIGMISQGFVQISSGAQGIAAGGGQPENVIPGQINIAFAGYSLIQRIDGTVISAGRSNYGELGNGVLFGTHSPFAQVASGIKAIDAGRSSSFYLKTDGSLLGSGLNGGRFGNGNSFESTTPIQIQTGVRSVKTGGNVTFFIRNDSTLWGTGSNANGQLGATAINSTLTPVQIMSEVQSVAPGSTHSLILKADGSVWAVGNNSFGQFGDGTNSTQRTPVRVMEGIKAVEASYGYSLFLKTDGTVLAAGLNTKRELGDGSTTNRYSAVQILDNVQAIAARNSGDNLYLKTDGTVWASGSNTWGQFGDGTRLPRPRPTQIATGVKGIAVGGYHILLLKLDNTVWAAGSYDAGQFGNGIRDWGPVKAFAILDPTLTIIAHPQGFTGNPGESGFLTVAANGTNPISYQWMKSGVAIPGANLPTLQFPSLKATDAGTYTVVLSNSAGSLTSSPALVSVNAALAAPLFSSHPSDATVVVGASVTLSASATGNPTPTYQWQYSPAGSQTWSNLADGNRYGGTGSRTLTITQTGAELSGSRFRVLASNSVQRDVPSNPAVLTVVYPPLTIVTQPIDATAPEGQTVFFSVTTAGPPTTKYRWQRSNDGRVWFDQPFGTLRQMGFPVRIQDSGSRYRVIVTDNGSAIVVSNAVLLTVVAPVRIVGQPQNQKVAAGSGARFMVNAVGLPVPAFQWQVSKDGGLTWTDLYDQGPYRGTSTNELIIEATPADLNLSRYRTKITAQNGSTIESGSAQLLVEEDLTVTNVSARQIDGNTLVIVTYDILSANLSPCTVKLEVSKDGGKTYVPATNPTFAVGEGVVPGVNKLIAWDANDDFPGVFLSNVKVRVTALRGVDQSPPPQMTLIPGGTFKMGDTTENGPTGDGPPRDVTISPFYLSPTEVSWQQWQTVRDWAIGNGYPDLAGIGAGKGPDHPVHSINYIDAVKWLNAKSEMEGRAPVYYAHASEFYQRYVVFDPFNYSGEPAVFRTGNASLLPEHARWGAGGYRLPTEAEWEFAARGGSEGRRFPNGNTLSHSAANYYSDPQIRLPYDTATEPWPIDAYLGGRPYTLPVGKFPMNGYGMFDMVGNVREWCWNVDATPSLTTQVIPGGALSTSGYASFFSRGGGWSDFARELRIAYRSGSSSLLRTNETGFRIAVRGLPSGSAISPNFQVDTRSAVWVSGRVVNFRDGQPVAGVTIEGPDSSRSTSDGKGLFGFSVRGLADGSWLLFSKSGYAFQKAEFRVPPGSTTIDIGEVRMSNRFEVTSAEPEFDAIYLQGISWNVSFRVRVNWNGATPGTIRWLTTDGIGGSVPAKGEEAEIEADIAKIFTSSNYFHAVTVTAVTSGGVQSAPFRIPMRIAEKPAFLREEFTLESVNSEAANRSLSMALKLPPKAVKWVNATLPFIQKMGADFSAEMRFNYSYTSGNWSLSLGASLSEKSVLSRRLLKTPLFIMGESELTLGLQGEAQGKVGVGSLWPNDVAVKINGSVKRELFQILLTDFVPAGQYVRLGEAFFAKTSWDPFSLQRIKVYGLLNGEYAAKVDLRKSEFAGTSLKITPGIEAVYKPENGTSKMEFTIGGDVASEFKLPYAEDSLQKIEARIYFKVQAIFLDTVVFEFEAVRLERWPSSASILSLESEDSESSSLGNVLTTTTLPRTIRRSALSKGSERFVATDPFAESVVTRVSPQTEADGGKRGALEDNIAVPGSTLIGGAYENASPSLASRNNELWAVYIRDNGGADSQHTDVSAMHFDGTRWTAPVAISSDPRADFAPQVRFDGNGDAVAVWQRTKGTVTPNGFASLPSQLEIASSRWNRATGLWSVPANLTENDFLDHGPQIAGPLANGDLIAIWRSNPGNVLVGTGEKGAVTNSRLMSATWSAATRSWQTPIVLVSELRSEGPPALDGRNQKAIVAWVGDLDGDSLTVADKEVFYRVFENGSWQVVQRLTENTSVEDAVRVAISANGTTDVVWRSDSEILWSRDMSPAQVIRTDSGSPALAEFALASSANGNVAMVWSDRNGDSTDLLYRNYDRNQAVWSEERPLFTDPALERSASLCFVGDEKLFAIYLTEEQRRTSKNFTMSNGEIVTINNIIETAPPDVAVVQRSLTTDLALKPADLQVRGTTFLPGDLVTLSALLRNEGDFAISRPKVSFFQGSPVNGGILLGQVVAADTLKAGSQAPVALQWSFPTTSDRISIYAVADHANEVPEQLENNNSVSALVGGSDLETTYLKSFSLEDGSVRLIAEIRNLGSPGCGSSSASLASIDHPAITASVAVPALGPGESAQVAFDLPPGSHPSREMRWQLTADSQGAVADVDRTNNIQRFSTLNSTPLRITIQPENQAVNLTNSGGIGNARFSVSVSGEPAPALRWQMSRNGGSDWIDVPDGAGVSGSTTAQLVLSGIGVEANGHQYRVVATVPGFSLPSNPAVLSVAIGPANWLSNISVRTAVGNEKSVIVGLVVRGGERKVLLRAVGPTLTQFGLTTAMTDPRMELYNDSAAERVDENDDWPANLADVFSQVGAFGLADGSKDAALVRVLGGGHTLHARGTSGGVVLVEGYDAGGGGAGRFVNLSARNRVGVGSDSLIAGFSLSGTGSRRVLIRAVGPTLRSFGVDSAIDNPKLEIFSGEKKVAENDDWNPALAATFSQVGAFSLLAGSTDSAIIVQIDANQSYSAVVTGIGESTGEALVEIYELP